MKMKLTIKSLLALPLAMLIGLFSLQSFAEEDSAANVNDYEQVEFDDAMIPEEEIMDEDVELETEEGEEPETSEPLSQSDEAETESDSEDDDQPKDSQLMFG